MRFYMPFEAFFEISLTSVTDIDLYISSGILTVTSSVRRHSVEGVLFLSEDCKLFYVNVTYENSQARERTQILMDVANKEGGIVIGTGDLSELALGWATYNGDHISMYGVNASIPKTLVKYLVGWAADNHFNENCSNAQRSVREILLDIIDTPISPELKPADNNGEIAQKTEDLVGPYELHDFFLYNMFRFGYAPSKIYFLARKAFVGVYDDAVILKWLKTFISRFFGQQFKRSCLPDGPKVGSVSLSPRGDWRMPSDAWKTMFLKDLENIEG